LKKHVKELTARVKVLVVENETLKAEVEIYRAEAAVGPPNSSNLAPNSEDTSNNNNGKVEGHDNEAFVRAGNGVYPCENEVTLPKLHDVSNPLCCALSADDTMLATGGADATIRLLQWGAALNPNMTPESVVQSACRVSCAAPVICTSFSPVLRGVLAAGSMDGSLHLVNYSTLTGEGIQASMQSVAAEFKHKKYVRAVAWSPTEPILATCSADGSVQVFKVERAGMDGEESQLTKIDSLHLGGGVESLCFVKDKLVCYARNTPYLSFFDLGMYI
jgi:WD40 repeat protein